MFSGSSQMRHNTQLKEISSKLGSELEEMHKVADNATRQLTNPPVAGGETHVVKK